MLSMLVGARLSAFHIRFLADELVLANLFNNADDIGTVANSGTVLCSNTFAMNGTPDGTTPLDIYLIV